MIRTTVDCGPGFPTLPSPSPRRTEKQSKYIYIHIFQLNYSRWIVLLRTAGPYTKLCQVKVPERQRSKVSKYIIRIIYVEIVLCKGGVAPLLYGFLPFTKQNPITNPYLKILDFSHLLRMPLGIFLPHYFIFIFGTPSKE